MYPKAIDPKKVGTYPAATFSGGGYFYDAVLEYRVWVHPENGDDDYYYVYETYEEALEKSENTERAEEPLVLILQEQYVDEPQAGVFVKKVNSRITEWCVEWLEGSKREKDSIDDFIKNNQKESFS